MVWTNVCENLRWNLGNSCNVNFLHDNWIDEVGPLVVYVGTLTRTALPIVFVAALLTTQGTWNWPLFQHFLPLSVLLHIAAVKEPDPLFPEDAVEWGLTTNHRFTIKSAYEHRSGTLNGDSDRVWMTIQKFQGLPKIKDLMFVVVLWNLWLHRSAVVFDSEVEEWGSAVSRSRWLASTTTTASWDAAPLVQRSSLEVSFRHIARNVNKVVDALAKLTNTSNFDMVTLVSPPLAIVSLLQGDVMSYFD
ncbi:hypothetical protein V6N13_105208 [Hibiscus sabdariffa]